MHLNCRGYAKTTFHWIFGRQSSRDRKRAQERKISEFNILQASSPESNTDTKIHVSKYCHTRKRKGSACCHCFGSTRIVNDRCTKKKKNSRFSRTNEVRLVRRNAKVKEKKKINRSRILTRYSRYIPKRSELKTFEHHVGFESPTNNFRIFSLLQNAAAR